MPVLIAATEAIADPMFTWSSLAVPAGGICSSWSMIHSQSSWVSKTVSALFPGERTRPIGRAMGLIGHNLAGHRPARSYMDLNGYILPLSSPSTRNASGDLAGQPHHVNAGFERETSTVSAGGRPKWGYQMYPTTSRAAAAAQVLAYDVTSGRESQS